MNVCRRRGEDKIIRGEELKVLEESSIWILKFTRKITGMAVDTGQGTGSRDLQGTGK